MNIDFSEIQHGTIKLQHLSTSSQIKLTVTSEEESTQGGELEAVEQELYLDYMQLNELIETVQLVTNTNQLEINLNDYFYFDVDENSSYGTITTVNGKELFCQNQDAGTIVKQILEHLGFNVKVTTSYNGELMGEIL